MEPGTHATSNGSASAPPVPYASSLGKDMPPARAIATGRPSLDMLGSGSAHTPRSPYTGASPRPFSAMQRGASGTGAADAAAADAYRQESYFAELLGYSLDRLAKEPELLVEDQKQLRRQQQETAVTQYRAFIQTADGLGAVARELAAAEASLDALLADAPALEAAAEGFAKTATALLAARAQNKQLHSYNGTVLELLEVPQLMDTCVRNGNYDEALDLRAYVNKLAFAHSDLPIVRMLVDEADAIADGLLQALLAKLRGPIQLPECLRVIGYLRRLATFSEQELRAQFLACREAWHGELVAELDDGGSPYDYLKRLTDVHRLHLFDVVMQYRAIFSDHSSAQEQGASDGGILYGWAEHRVVFYLEALQRHLPRVAEGGSLASVLEHCMYCGMSLARVGLDFRGLLPPIFEAAIANVFNKALATAVDTFGAVLETHRWVPSSALAARSRRTTDDRSAGGTAAGATAGGEDDAAPPYVLMEAPPLAVFVNGVLAALNELRHCAPLALRDLFAARLQEALTRVVGALAHAGATRSLTDSEQQLFSAGCKTATKVMTPYLAASFGRVYPGGAALVDLPAVNRPLLELIASWEAPPSQAPVAAPKPAKPAERPTGPPPAQTVPSAPGAGDAGVQPDAAAKPGGVSGSAIPRPPISKAVGGAATASAPPVSTAASRLPKPPSATQ